MAYLFGNWRPRVRVPPLRPKDKDCLLWQSFFLFPRNSNQGSPTARKHSRCASLVPLSFNSLFCSGASSKTIINCFMPRLPATSTNKKGASLWCSFFYLMPDYTLGPALTSALPASLPVYLSKFFTKRAARSFAFASHSEASA